MEHLGSLPVAPLRLHLVTTGAFRTPEYKGSLFRGGFGQFFRDLVCVSRKDLADEEASQAQLGDLVIWRFADFAERLT